MSWRPHWRSKDALEQIGAVGAGLIVYALTKQFVDPVWDEVLFFGLFCVSNALLKFWRPTNAILQDASWPTLFFTAAVVMVGAFFIGNTSILGGWTLPFIFALFIGYGLWRIVSELSPEDDE